MINQTRTLLVVALAAVIILLWQAWQHDYAPPPAPTPAAATSAVPSSANTVPSATTAGATASAPAATPAIATQPPGSEAASATPARDLVTATSDLLQLTIDPRGGTIVGAALLKYPQTVKRGSGPVNLLNDTQRDYYVAQNGIVGVDGSAAPTHLAEFVPSATHYALAAGQKQVVVTLTWHDPATAVSVIKRYTLTRGSYVVGLSQEVINHGKTTWHGSAYEQLDRVEPPPPPKHLLEIYNPDTWAYTGAAWYSPENKFSRFKFGDFKSEPLKQAATGGWVAMVQRFFVAAWIPPEHVAQQFGSAEVEPTGADGKPRYLIRSMGPTLAAAPGASVSSDARLYIGPILQNHLDQVAPGLSLSVAYYPYIAWAAVPMFKILAFLHRLVHNWGVAIIVLVLLIQGVTWKLSEKQYVSSARMRKLAPRLKALKERFGDDKQKYQQAMMELYKKEKVNPMAGCLPQLIIYPIFFALYYVLIFSVELRHAAFLWIPDLSAADPFFILPVLYALTMLGSQYLTPMQGMDPNTAKIMKFMPVAFAVLFFFFPAGLTLYYVVRQICMLGQQWYVYRKIDQAEARARA